MLFLVLNGGTDDRDGHVGPGFAEQVTACHRGVAYAYVEDGIKDGVFLRLSFEKILDERAAFFQVLMATAAFRRPPSWPRRAAEWVLLKSAPFRARTWTRF